MVHRDAAAPDAAARFLVTAFNSGAGQFFTYLYFASEYAARHAPEAPPP